jgi:hypothetical protein
MPNISVQSANAGTMAIDKRHMASLNRALMSLEEMSAH